MATQRVKNERKVPHRLRKVLVVDVGGTNVKILATG